MNPIIPIEKLILLVLVLAPLGGWLAWRSAAVASTRLRMVLTALRVLGLLVLAVAAFNPGHRKTRSNAEASVWALLVDNSESMLQRDVNNQTRLDAATGIAGKALKASANPDRVRTATFSDALRHVVDGYKTVQSQAGNTDIAGSGKSVLAEFAGTRRLRGMLLLSDGRQVAPTSADAFALHALAQGVPLYAVALGGRVTQRDLRVQSSRREYVAFKGQSVNIDIRVAGEALGPVIVPVELHAADGAVITRKEVSLSNDTPVATLGFELEDIPPGRHQFSCHVALQQDEPVEWNNHDTFEVVVLENAISVLHVEGLPYWDSKFLMQLVRRQPNMSVSSVYRVGEGRFFKVESDAKKAEVVKDLVFPETIDELGQYDMVILGKGCEYMLTPAAIRVLREFVRDLGGSLIFSRGKPYHGSLPDLEPLEAGEWGGAVASELSLLPTVAGEDMGLFNRLLPGRNDPVWSSLPPIRHAHTFTTLNSFTRVMATGKLGTADNDRGIPLIASRRYGKGMILTINADGIWQWGFLPSVEQADKMYNEIWAQLLNWTVTYGEFLPGEDLSIRIGSSTMPVGSTTHVQVYHRPTEVALTPPTLTLSRDGSPAGQCPLVAHGDDPLRWDGVLSLNAPGVYRIQIQTAIGRGPERTLTVVPEADEMTLESADRKYLETLCAATGGSLIEPDGVSTLVQQFESVDTTPEDVETEWNPLWDNPLYLMLLFIPFLMEWFLRRRNGLL